MKYQCSATTKKGERCKAFVSTVDRGDTPWYCGSHGRHYGEWMRAKLALR